MNTINFCPEFERILFLSLFLALPLNLCLDLPVHYVPIAPYNSWKTSLKDGYGSTYLLARSSEIDSKYVDWRNLRVWQNISLALIDNSSLYMHIEKKPREVLVADLRYPGCKISWIGTTIVISSVFFKVEISRTVWIHISMKMVISSQIELWLL